MINRFVRIALIGLLIAYTNILLAQSSFTAQNGAALGKDAYISNHPSNVTLPFGNYPELVGQVWTSGGTLFASRSLIQFDLSSIPSNAVVTKATLTLFGTSHDINYISNSVSYKTNAFYIKKITSSWDEIAVSWESQPNTTTIGQIAFNGCTTTTQDYVISVNDLIQDMITNSENNFGFMIQLQNEVDKFSKFGFASSDNANSAKWPKLLVEYWVPQTCSNDLNKNWVNSKVFGEFGQIISERQSFSDYLGRPTQNQSRALSDDNVLANQIIYDAIGRPAIQTLAAPTNSPNICYKDYFVTNSGNTLYDYKDFDLPNPPLLVTAGIVDNPNPIGNSTIGTLGWYYSNNNSIENFVPTSSFPYQRSEYNDFSLGGIKRSTLAGDYLNMGSGHESFQVTIPSSGEFNYLHGFGHKWVISQTEAGVSNLSKLESAPSISCNKTISIDQNGIQTIAFSDFDGKILAKCSSGPKDGVISSVMHLMSYIGTGSKDSKYVDIHISQGCESTLDLYNNEVQASGQTIAIVYNILNLKTGKYVRIGGSSDITIRNPVLTSGVYRILFKSSNIIRNLLPIKYDASYYDFTLYLYDKSNRLKSIIPPSGIDKGYSPNPVISQNQKWSKFSYVAAPSGVNPNWSLSPTGYVNQISIPVTPPTINEEQFTSVEVQLLRDVIDDAARDQGGVNKTAGISYFSSDLTSSTYNVGSCNGCNPPDNPEQWYKSYKYDIYMDIGVQTPSGKIKVSQIVIQAEQAFGCPTCDNNFWYVNNSENPQKALIDLDLSRKATNVYVEVTKIIGNEYFNDAYIGPLVVDNRINGLKLSLYAFTSKVDVVPTHTMSTNYSYNSNGSLVSEINSPDEGITKNVYRKDGNIRFSQNASQVNKSFTYINYDLSGRVRETGEYKMDAIAPTAGFTNLLFESTVNNVPSNASSILNDAILNNVSIADASGFDVSAVIDPAKCSQRSFTFYDSPDPSFYSLTGLSSNYSQEFLLGKTSKTKNENTTIWYSYDELGRLAWMVQRIEGMPELGTGSTFSIKTINYTYDLTGNIQQITFQKEKPSEDFYHFYNYDKDSRLSSVYTSIDGVNKEKQADYFYYLHGPLKRVELANKLQGIDYVYTINGWIKSINSPENSLRDPGTDGFGATGKKSSAPTDLFGMTLDYFSGDYVRLGTYVQTYTADPYQLRGDPNWYFPDNGDKFNGLIRTQRWQTTTPASATISYAGNQLMTKYLYDNKYQLTSAQFGAIIALGSKNPLIPPPTAVFPGPNYSPKFSASEDYKLSGITYDSNGNIQTLNRNAYTTGLGGLNLDQLRYKYLANTNKLDSVIDSEPSNVYTDLNYTGGKNKYKYNAIGQMTTDNNGNTYEYNLAGKIISIKKSDSSPKATFTYDANGFRLKKTVFNGAGTTNTWYVRDAAGSILSVYDNNNATATLKQKEFPIYGASRIGMVDMSYSPAQTVYELSDHLGNVRSTFNKVKDYTISTGFEETGEDDYLFDFNNTLDKTVWRIAPTCSSCTTSIKTDPINQYGPVIKIPVTAGQIVNVTCYYQHSSVAQPLAGIVRYLEEADTKTPAGLDFGWTLVGAQTGTGNTTDKWKPVTYSYTVPSSTGNIKNFLLYIYPWNNGSAGGPTVWFDDLSITITPIAGVGGIDKPNPLSITDYYPHGSPMPGRNFSNYRFQYQGQFAEKDVETGFTDFDLRQWDGKLGRWMTPDPYGQYHSPYLGMGNNPASGIDEDGGYSYAGALWRHALVSLVTDVNPVYQSGTEWGFSQKGFDGTYTHSFGKKELDRSVIQDIIDDAVVPSGIPWDSKLTMNWPAAKGNIDADYTFENIIIGGMAIKGISLGFAAEEVTSLGAGRMGVKKWLQNAGNLERGELIKDIESAGFKKVFDGKGMMHFERGGMKIRLDPPQLGTPFNHMHLNFGGNKNTYDIFLNAVDFKSSAAHIPIR